MSNGTTTVVAEDDDVLDVILADDTIERLDHFLDVVEVEILGAALIASLRPAAHRVAARLDAFDLLAPFDRSETEHENACLVGVEHDGGVTGILIDQPHERIQVRHAADEQPVVVDRHAQLDRDEIVGGSGRRENRQAVRGGRHFVGEVGGDALDVARQVGVISGMILQGTQLIGECLATEGLVVVTSVLVRSQDSDTD